MRRAFSKPTRVEEEFVALMTDFRSAGYEGLQLKMGQFMPYVDEPETYLSRWGDDPGRASGLIFFDSLESAAVEKLRATIRFAERIGTERVVFCHNRSREGMTEADLVGYARTLSQIGSDAAERGVKLSLHHHFNQPVMLPADFEVFFGAVEPETVGLTIDTAHLAKSGIGDIPAFIRQVARVIDNVHFKDYQDGEWHILGQGSLDLDGILTALREMDYTGWLCVDEESSASLREGLVASREWLDSHL